MGIFDFFNKNKRKMKKGQGRLTYGRRLMWQSHNVMKKREKKSF